MKLNKEVRKISKELFQGSFVEGSSTRTRCAVSCSRSSPASRAITSDILKNYHRLIRLEIGETPRHHRERRGA